MKAIIRLFLVVALVAFASTASALTISGGTDVGEEDTIVAWGMLGNSGDQTEVDFVNGYFTAEGIQSSWLVEEYFKDENMGDDYGGTNPWIAVDGQTQGEDLYAYDFGLNGASYYLIKLGNIGVSQDEIPDSDPLKYYKYDTFLYKNVDSFQYAVVSLSELEGYGSKSVDIFKISHIGAPVPEPSTLLLLGAGIVGLVAYRRKKN